MNITERVALAIAEEYPEHRQAALQIAEQLVAAAEADGIPVTDLTLWIRDKPRHDLSTFAWRQWLKRYGPKPSTLVKMEGQ